ARELAETRRDPAISLEEQAQLIWAEAKEERKTKEREAREQHAADKASTEPRSGMEVVPVPMPLRLAQLVTKVSRQDVLDAGVAELRSSFSRPVLTPAGDVVSCRYEPEGRVLSLCDVAGYEMPRSAEECREILTDPFCDFPFRGPE